MDRDQRVDDGVHSYEFGTYAIRVTTRAVHGSPLQIVKDGLCIFEAPAEPDWIRLYNRGYALPESRGFFFPKALGKVSVKAGWPSACDAIKNGIVLQGESAMGTWSMEIICRDAHRLTIKLESEASRVELRSRRRNGAKIFGLGAQFSHLNLDGKRVPMISQEPGIGRGVQPLTFMLNATVGAGGSSVQSNAPSPFFFTDQWCGYLLEGHAVSFLDFTGGDELLWDVNHGVVELSLWAEDKPSELLQHYTHHIGRMRPLPDWIHRGAVVGLQGGSNRLQVLHEQLAAAEVRVAAYWLQDWVGQRKTSIGWQLWWNWELDHDHYPDWKSDRDRLAASDIRLMTYINPFLVDLSDKSNVRRDLFQEAKAHGYLVKNSQGNPYPIGHTSFSTYMVDLTNPDAWDWMKAVVVTQVLAAGSSGWMTDFGEALPCDAVLSDGRSAETYHNEYPIDWAKLVDEAITESGRDDIVPFHRSGFHRSPRFARLFWLGDQLVSWSQADGIKSAVVGLISSGLSGFSLSHSDVGGYTSTDLIPGGIKVPGLTFYRRKELLLRWIELNAFTAVFRTHEGNQPQKNVQIDAGGDVTEHFAYFSQVFAALFDYRKREMVRVEEAGWPMVRPIWFHHPEAVAAYSDMLAFSLGRWVYVYPVLDRGATEVNVYLPPGRYHHLFTGEIVSGGREFLHPAPLGCPAVFVEECEPELITLLSAVQGIPKPSHL